MKNKKIVGLLTLASCVILGGCDFSFDKITDTVKSIPDSVMSIFGKKEDEKPDEPKVPSVEMLDLPIAVEVDSQIDLDDYVTLVNATEYSVVVDADSAALASAEGHYLTFSGEGTVNFKIVVGEVEFAYSIVSSSAARAGLATGFSDVGKDYTLLSYDYDETYGVYVDDVIVHGEDYIVSYGSWDYDEETQEAIPGGFLSFSGKETYSFNLVTTGEGENATTEVVCNSSIYSHMYLESYNCDLALDFAKMDRVVDENFGETFEMTDEEDMAAFLEGSCFVPRGEFTYYTDTTYTTTVTYVPTRVVFVPINVADEGQPADYSQEVEAVVYVSMEGSTEELGTIADFVICLEDEMVGEEAVETFLADESNIPAGIDYNSYFNIHSYFGATQTYKFGFASIEYGWYDNGSYEFLADAPADVSGTICEGFPMGSSQTIFSEDIIATMDSTGSWHGQSQQMVGEGEDQTLQVYDFEQSGQYIYGYANNEVSSIWDNDEINLSFFADSASYASDLFAEAQAVNVGTEETPVTAYYAKFNVYRGDSFLDAICMFDSGLSVILSEFEKYSSYINFYDYFEGTAKIIPTKGLVIFDFALSWDESTSYMIEMTFQVSNAYESYATAVAGAIQYVE